jgi:LuxR family maltose regulon positive regulatory protein
MQQRSLLATKLNIPPIRPESVSRPRLIERLSAALPTGDDSPRTRDGFSRTRDAFSRTRDGFSRALTLISAPAGFGKTTLVSEWIHKVGAHGDAPPHVAWLSLDEGDNDPARFLAYLITALQTIEANMAKGMLGALRSPGVAGATTPPPVEEILTVLINEIAATPHRIVLVLDDYHLIEAQPIHDALTFLLERRPQQMHLVIATREDPLLPLARLRVRGQLTEIRATDLRFTSSEAAEFLNRMMGLDLSAEDIAALEARTEGWIAGLQLAALALQGPISMQGRKDAASLIQAFAGSHRYVLDYLVEEVLEQQSESVQAFLLQTAILDRLTGSLCDAVRFGEAKASSTPRGDAVRFGEAKSADRSIRAATPGGDAVRFGEAKSRNGRATLESLERANLFLIPLDGERRWYRYHHLFLDLLRQRLRQTQPEWIPTLHRRASEWYEQNGFVDQSIEHALQTEDLERPARLIDQHAEAMWLRGEHAKLQRWLTVLPDKVVLCRPQLCIFHAWYLFASGQQDEAERRLQACEQRFEPATMGATEASAPDEQVRISDADRMKLRGMAAVIRAFMATYMGDVEAMAVHARRALELLPEQDLIWRSNAAIALGDAHGFKGDMAAAYQARLQAAEAAAQAGDTIFSTVAYLKVAVTLREQGQLQRTIEICRREIQRADSSGLPRGSVVGALLAIWGEALAELGDIEGAIDLANQGVALTERSLDLAMRGWSYLCLARILFSTGDMAGVEAIVQKAEATARDSNLPAWITTQMEAWRARMWLAQGRLEAASEWAAQRELDTGGEPKPLHELDFASLLDQVMLARILIAEGRLDEADELLPCLLEAAEVGGRTSRSIEILVLQALAFQAGGSTTRAMPALERALALAEPEGFIRIFVDEGPPMARLLYEAAAREIASEYARRLLAAFPIAQSEQAEPSKSQVPESEMVEPLSEREIEVLQLIAEGLTNREIASRFFLSVNTVKAHTRNIYGKLGVRSRTQAVARARGLGILPPI